MECGDAWGARKQAAARPQATQRTESRGMKPKHSPFSPASPAYLFSLPAIVTKFAGAVYTLFSIRPYSVKNLRHWGARKKVEKTPKSVPLSATFFAFFGARHSGIMAYRNIEILHNGPFLAPRTPYLGQRRQISVKRVAKRAKKLSQRTRIVSNSPGALPGRGRDARVVLGYRSRV
jgi:hypothetical protein